ncbi:hypothetical protein MLD38_005005 [Melastoma candidum]|uniref:Uncharacterized protein n=1 Tax=Melastoma candidum TaxID=119954 RepID=A0ACB9S8C2_9MYRT|nr:hypothetical protein MLD38_005005 [Melastoma candidum]
MGGSLEVPSSSFSCEMRILQAKNTDTLQPAPSSGGYFVRLILSAGKDRHVRLETREIQPKSKLGLDWDESFALQCSGSQDSMEWLKHQTVTFELRYRNKASGLRRFLGTRSKLIGKAEAPWKDVFESPHTVIETWVRMVPCNSCHQGCENAPSLRIAMSLSINGDSLMAKKGQDRARNHCECRCNDCDSYISTLDYDVFAIVAALDAL